MACFYPLKGYRSAEVNPETGKRGIVFNPTEALIEGAGGFLTLPCGQCRGCRVDTAQSWAARCVHESKLYDDNCFLTLTYDDQHVPQDYSLKKRDLQLFLKRLRERIDVRVRFRACGEYGDENGRPHYHLLLYNFAFPDRKPWAKRNDNMSWKSELLGEVWPFGLHEIGTLTGQSAAYVARYVLKKMTGVRADDYYRRVSPVDGETYQVEPEFSTVSLKPGLGSGWFDKFASDAFPSDFLILDGRKIRPPKFYLEKLEEAAQVPIKRKRKLAAAQPAAKHERTAPRLRVREVVMVSRMSVLKRPV